MLFVLVTLVSVLITMPLSTRCQNVSLQSDKLLYAHSSLGGISSSIKDSDENYIMLIRLTDGIFFTKTNAKGDVEWMKKLDVYHLSDVCFVENKQGGFLVSYLSEQSNNLSVLYVNKDGSVLRDMKSIGAGHSSPYAITNAYDDGYIIVGAVYPSGHGSPNPFVMKIDKYANIVWRKIYHNADYGSARLIMKTHDGNYIVAGHSDNEFGWVTKINKVGDQVWKHDYHEFFVGSISSVLENQNGDYVLVGHHARDRHDYLRLLILKVDHHGNKIWQKKYDNQSEGLSHTFALSIKENKDGTYFVSGGSYFIDNAYHPAPLLLLIDSDGNEVGRHDSYRERDTYTGVKILASSEDTHEVIGMFYDKKADRYCIRTLTFVQSESLTEAVSITNFSVDLVSVKDHVYRAKACISTRQPCKVSLYVNDTLVFSIDQEVVVPVDCGVNLNQPLVLQEGNNVIKIIVTDSTGSTITKTQSILTKK